MKNKMLAGWLAATALMTSAALAQAPPNDDIGNAVPFTSVPFQTSANTVEATTEPDEPTCAGSAATVWYAFTPTVSQSIEINTFSSNYDTTLAVYTGEPGSQIACNDDTPGSTQSRVIFDATAGETYYVQAGSWGGGPGGNLVLTASVAPPVPEIELLIATTGSFSSKTGTAVIRGTVACSTETIVDISVSATQRAGRLIIGGFGGTSVTCDGATPFAVSVTGGNGRFVGGKLDVTVNAFGCNAAGCDSDETITTVRLQGR